jgi:hypothetical protein
MNPNMMPLSRPGGAFLAVAADHPKAFSLMIKSEAKLRMAIVTRFHQLSRSPLYRKTR